MPLIMPIRPPRDNPPERSRRTARVVAPHSEIARDPGPRASKALVRQEHYRRNLTDFVGNRPIPADRSPDFRFAKRSYLNDQHRFTSKSPSVRTSSGTSRKRKRRTLRNGRFGTCPEPGSPRRTRRPRRENRPRFRFAKRSYLIDQQCFTSNFSSVRPPSVTSRKRKRRTHSQRSGSVSDGAFGSLPDSVS